MLVEKGRADLSIKNNDGKTALDKAKEKNKTEVVAYLESIPNGVLPQIRQQQPQLPTKEAQRAATTATGR